MKLASGVRSAQPRSRFNTHRALCVGHAAANVIQACACATSSTPSATGTSAAGPSRRFFQSLFAAFAHSSPLHRLMQGDSPAAVTSLEAGGRRNGEQGARLTALLSALVLSLVCPRVAGQLLARHHSPARAPPRPSTPSPAARLLPARQNEVCTRVHWARAWESVWDLTDANTRAMWMDTRSHF